MPTFHLVAILVTLTALFSYLNHRYIHLHTSIGVMLIALVLSLGIILLGDLGLGIKQWANELVQKLDFNQAVLQWMLGALLFAGSLHVDINELSRHRGVVGLLATFGTAASMLIVGSLTWLTLHWLGLALPLIDCFLFGALISPTDPVAVLAVMKSAGAPKSLETKIAGESLFNDGIGVVLFLTLLGVARGAEPVAAGHLLSLLLHQVAGGALIGFLAGLTAYSMLKRVDQYQVEVLITLALVLGGYALAESLHTSAPIAMVVAGLLIGNQGRAFAMSPNTRLHLDMFWLLIDEILNAILFVMIGLEVLVMHFTTLHLLAVLLIIPIVLLAAGSASAHPSCSTSGATASHASPSPSSPGPACAAASPSLWPSPSPQAPTAPPSWPSPTASSSSPSSFRAPPSNPSSAAAHHPSPPHLIEQYISPQPSPPNTP